MDPVSILVARYRKHPDFKYFIFDAGCSQLPQKISIEETIQRQRINAKKVLRDVLNRKHISGLIEVRPGWWYFGDIELSEERSFFSLRQEGEFVELFVTENFYPDSPFRFADYLKNEIEKAERQPGLNLKKINFIIQFKSFELCLQR